jgi:DNA-binding HxlR family transcriptional regulator
MVAMTRRSNTRSRKALLVMRELFFGPKRCSDLRSDLPGISANVLTQRLEGLEASGVVRRARLQPPAAAEIGVHRHPGW